MYHCKMNGSKDERLNSVCRCKENPFLVKAVEGEGLCMSREGKSGCILRRRQEFILYKELCSWKKFQNMVEAGADVCYTKVDRGK